MGPDQTVVNANTSLDDFLQQTEEKDGAMLDTPSSARVPLTDNTNLPQNRSVTASTKAGGGGKGVPSLSFHGQDSGSSHADISKKSTLTPQGKASTMQ